MLTKKASTHSDHDFTLKPTKILFFIPNFQWFGKVPWKMVNYAALILTRMLKDEYDFEIFEANTNALTETECKKKLKEIKPDIVMISAHSTEYSRHYHVAAEIVKESCPNAITIMGGVYPTVIEAEVMKDKSIDYLFLGHAEERINEFLRLVLSSDKEALRHFAGIAYRDTNDELIFNPVKSYIGDVKEHVKPDYSKMDLTPYLDQKIKNYQVNANELSAAIITSYGCCHNCVFCATRTISGNKVVFRPAEDIIEEIEYLRTEYGVNFIVFLDDLFLADRQRIEKILNYFIEKKYNLKWKVATVAAWHLDDKILELFKRSGCTQITISIESGSPRVLRKIIRKPLKLEIIQGIIDKCKELGLSIGGNFVIGLPGETWHEIRETFRFAEKCNLDLAHFHIATPLPKTDLYRVAKEQNLLPEGFNFSDPKYFGFGRGFITTDEFTPFELHVLRAFEWDRINFSSPEKIQKASEMMGISVAELNEHRKQTRKKIGIHF